MKITVLGAGLVGGPMALDLARDNRFEVKVADRSGDALARLDGRGPLQLEKADLDRAETVQEVVRDSDLVISAVPGFMGFKTLRTLIKAGKNVVDIAFFPEDPFALDEAAKHHNVTVVTDCGVAPGMSNILTAYGAGLLDEASSAEIYVGGLPVIRTWPWEYKAVFSPCDVIEEYVRPARLVENGRVVIKPALSEPELLDFPGVGTLEAFNSDGLRTLARTLTIPQMKEKTMRYPGHIEKISVLRDLGLFSTEPLTVAGQTIRPLDLTSALLFPKWKLAAGEIDLTVMKVRVTGLKDGLKTCHEFDLLDRADEVNGIHSMARTTGYTATGVARLLAAGKCRRTGLVVPEYLGQDGEFCRALLADLAERGVNYSHRVSHPPQTE
jgi:lysine 6-dehydrogenase